MCSRLHAVLLIDWLIALSSLHLIVGIYCVQADTPGGMECGIEDGEIVVDESEQQEQLSEQEGQDAEYDPLMAGNLEVFSTESLPNLYRAL